jgi:16S rRNA (cytosine1402-N4)-methyltransferase
MSDNSAGGRHVPVLVREVVDLLGPQPGQVIVDATLGAGGHSALLAEGVGPTGRVIGIDCDREMLSLARQRLAGLPVTFLHGNFADLEQILSTQGIEKVDAILADLGFCSDQVEAGERGFSFSREGPLDMRLDTTRGETAQDLLERLSERDLADLIWRYGEERHSRRIARRIVEARKAGPLDTTTQLAELVRRCVRRSGGIDPATRTFQALRIAVNDELGSLEQLLEALPRCLKPGGRVAIISFHSLEDRRVKQTLRNREVWRVLNKKPIQASDEEQRTNPRARSAKLRGAVYVQGMNEEPLKGKR